MPRFPATQDQPVLGPVKVVPPQGLAALRGLHLDRVRAPAVTWQLTEAGQSKISSNQVSTLSGEPRRDAGGGGWRLGTLRPRPLHVRLRLRSYTGSRPSAWPRSP